ncbi:type II toxin-antitoxin system RelE/ParE family toxin [uncultured Pseudosulfitobacter sp.]|jgi:toxin ParE1/3/4|uniref:type II toxin-antitoxin system RelE/ParE family toxin n=1 Tax=uncultured Pseudosulfitobacter sp. TaxID=2854214 RepID=UPI0030DDC2A1|tara:strand:+ start:261 stop:569 length:309 start_codon:yes stop_codon:yes gene_type:complete
MASSGRWSLRPAAQADIADIWQHGAANWGVDQADRYADGLFAVFDLIADFPEMASERVEFTPPVRIHPTGAHLVIYRADGQGVEVIRLRHAAQNLTAFLLDR